MWNDVRFAFDIAILYVRLMRASSRAVSNHVLQIPTLTKCKYLTYVVFLDPECWLLGLLQRSDAVGLVVIDEEDNQTLLVHRISADDIYRRQEGVYMCITN